MAKTVKATKVEKAPKEKKTTPTYSGGQRDAAGKLTVAVPEGFEFGKHKPLKKEDFASAGTFLEYRAATLDFRASRIVKSANDMREKAKRMVTFGDSITNKKVSKLQRLENAAQSLLAELKGELSAEQIAELVAGLQKSISA